MLKIFSRYFSVGIVNTAIHWSIFSMVFYGFHKEQSLSNFAGFCVAVTFSFFANAHFTFKSSTTTLRYMLYVGFMGGLSVVTGWVADRLSVPPIITVVTFSGMSLIIGFFYAKFIVFNDK